MSAVATDVRLADAIRALQATRDYDYHRWNCRLAAREGESICRECTRLKEAMVDLRSAILDKADAR